MDENEGQVHRPWKKKFSFVRRPFRDLERGTRFCYREDGPRYVVSEWADGTRTSTQLTGPSRGKVWSIEPTAEVLEIKYPS